MRTPEEGTVPCACVTILGASEGEKTLSSLYSKVFSIYLVDFFIKFHPYLGGSSANRTSANGTLANGTLANGTLANRTSVIRTCASDQEKRRRGARSQETSAKNERRNISLHGTIILFEISLHFICGVVRLGKSSIMYCVLEEFNI